MNYKVSMKINGKWHTVGSVKKNKYGNMSLGLMKKPEVQEALKGDGWANFALFEDDGERKPKQQAPDKEEDSTIPF